MHSVVSVIQLLSFLISSLTTLEHHIAILIAAILFLNHHSTQTCVWPSLDGCTNPDPQRAASTGPVWLAGSYVVVLAVETSHRAFKVALASRELPLAGNEPTSDDSG
jgi:hypothetical protein